MTRTWFTADHHYGHKNILSHEAESRHEAGGDVERMNQLMTERWNDLVAPEDTVWHLGDFSFLSRSKTREVLEQLNGTKHLVAGNHDGRGTTKLDWASVQDMAEVKVDDQHFVLCHYPLMTWNRAHHGAIHLHGHSHGNIPQSSTRFDVGVDAVQGWLPGTWFGEPVNAQQIIHHVEANGIQYDYIDHHTGARP